MIFDYQTPDPGWCGDRRRGASHGRASNLPTGFKGPLQLRHVPLDAGGYDPGGSYWGSPDNDPDNLYMAADAKGRVRYVRASSLADARKQFPWATFPTPVEVTEADIDDMLQGYVECALWSTNDESNESGGVPFDQNYDSSDVAAETLDYMREDCEKFARENAADLLEGIASGRKGITWSRAGHDFWLSRNSHGAGFGDGDWPDPQDKRLDEAAEKYDTVNLYVESLDDGGDGKIRS